MILSPTAGSLVYEYYGNFNQTCDVFGFLGIIYVVIYYLGNILPDRKTIWQYDREKQKDEFALN
jgi:hypothetical protein